MSERIAIFIIAMREQLYNFTESQVTLCHAWAAATELNMSAEGNNKRNLKIANVLLFVVTLIQ